MTAELIERAEGVGVVVGGVTYSYHPWAGGYRWWNTYNASHKEGTQTFALVEEVARLCAELERLSNPWIKVDDWETQIRVRVLGGNAGEGWQEVVCHDGDGWCNADGYGPRHITHVKHLDDLPETIT
jgi:hypothetical protein